MKDKVFLEKVQISVYSIKHSLYFYTAEFSTSTLQQLCDEKNPLKIYISISNIK